MKWVTDGGEKIHFWRKRVAFLIGFFDLTGEEDRDVLLGVLMRLSQSQVLRRVSAVALGMEATIENDAVDGLGVIEERLRIGGGVAGSRGLKPSCLVNFLRRSCNSETAARAWRLSAKSGTLTLPRPHLLLPFVGRQ